MPEERSVRKLAAIVSADAVGYTRLIRAGETRTRAILNRHFSEIFAPAIAGHGGRIVKTLGDGLLAEFQSVVEAVEAAIVIQAGLALANEGLSADARMDFRIGINLGDVLVEGDDIHGDGVNLAARLESLAEPGGICVSAGVREHVRHILPQRFEDMGLRQVKNVAEPIAAFRLLPGESEDPPEGPVPPPPQRAGRRGYPLVLAAGLAVALLAGGGFATWRALQPDVPPVDIGDMAFPLPDKPSIAVLPLVDGSGDPDQAYFTDGLTEDLITRLAGYPNLFVIARNSTEKFRGQATDIREVAADLGVRYVMEGGVRRADDAIRINIRLIDAVRGANVWAGTYDRRSADVFALQDEITAEVVSRLASNVVEAEFSRHSAGGTSDLAAYELFLRGWHTFHKILTPQSNARAIELLALALERDPGYARALSALALGRAQNVRFGWAREQGDTFEAALALARRAVELAPDDYYSLHGLGAVLRLATHYEEAIVTYQKALALSPSNPGVLISLALTQAYAGRGAEAVESAALALRLDPHASPAYYQWRGTAFYVNGDYEAALPDFRRFNAANPNLVVSHLFLAATLAQLGHAEEAAATTGELLSRAPKFTIRGFLEDVRPLGVARERIMEGLAKAGIPDGGST